MNGELVAVRNTDDGSLIVLQADPTILIGADLLDEWRSGNCDPHVNLDEDVVTLTATNGVFRYLITEEAHTDSQAHVAVRLP